MKERFEVNRQIKFHTLIPFLTLLTDLCLSKRITCPKIMKLAYDTLFTETKESLKEKHAFSQKL